MTLPITDSGFTTQTTKERNIGNLSKHHIAIIMRELGLNIAYRRITNCFDYLQEVFVEKKDLCPLYFKNNLSDVLSVNRFSVHVQQGNGLSRH